MKKGTVKFFNNTKGFGFIKEEGSSQDIFVHVSGLSR
jgi:CspA family cold shock protein